MGIQTYSLGDFYDIKSRKGGGEAFVVKGVHCHHGYKIQKWQIIYYFSEVAIKTWHRVSDINAKEVELLMEVKELIRGANHLIQNAYHQNIIQLLGILVDGNSKCIGYIMPYMSMGSLKDGSIAPD